MHHVFASDDNSLSNNSSIELCSIGMPQADGHETKSREVDVQAIFRWMLLWVLLHDAHNNSCRDFYPSPTNNPLPNHNPLPHNYAPPNNCTNYLQEVLLPSQPRAGRKA